MKETVEEKVLPAIGELCRACRENDVPCLLMVKTDSDTVNTSYHGSVDTFLRMISGTLVDISIEADAPLDEVLAYTAMLAKAWQNEHGGADRE